MTSENRPGSLALLPPWLRVALALAVVALAYSYRLDRPLLWDDEAETGILSRNVLHWGYPRAFDGRNVSVFENGAQLNRHLVRTELPWAQFYVGALSLKLFGDSTAGLRVLFAVVGWLAFFPLYAVFKRRVPWPEFAAALVLVAPQTVLFQRNARYYPILILLYAVLVWQLSEPAKNLKLRWWLAGLVMVLFFQTHSFAATCAALSAILYCALFRRELLLVYLAAAAAGFLSWFAWKILVGPSVESLTWLMGSNFSLWSERFGPALLAMLLDLDVTDCVPILFWVAMVITLLWRGRQTWARFGREPLIAFVGLTLLVQAVATAASFGTETASRYALLRYQPHLMVLALASALYALSRIARIPALFGLVGAIVVGSNLSTVSYWVKLSHRVVPVSWLAPVYTEIFQPQPGALEAAIERLRVESNAAQNPEVVIAAFPYWVQESVIFYLGDSYLVRPTREPRDPAFEGALWSTMGPERYQRLFSQPEWIIDVLTVLESPAGYTNAAIFPSFRDRPDNGVRPELTRHTFLQAGVVTNCVLYRACAAPRN